MPASFHRSLVAVITAIIALGAGLSAQNVLTPEAMWQLQKIAAATVSPDGKQVAYLVMVADVAEDKSHGDIFVVPTTGGAPERLTNDPGVEGDLQWIQTPAGARLFFIAQREKDEAPQVYACDVAAKAFTRVTNQPEGCANLKVAPNAKRIAYTVDVKLDQTVNEIYKDLPKAKARIIDGLMYRHWNQWHDFAYSHVFIAELGDGLLATNARDVMEGLRTDCPLPPDGGNEEIAWSPDGDELAFVMKIVANEARSTDSDVYLLKADGSSKMQNITDGMDGYDKDPVYSPDGHYVAFTSMANPGYESDRNRLMIFDRKENRNIDLSDGWDQTVHDLTWTKDSKTIYFKSEHRGTEQIFKTAIDAPKAEPVTRSRANFSLFGFTADEKTMICGLTTMIAPMELATVSAESGNIAMITALNKETMAKLALPTVEERWTRATDGQQIHSWVVYPPNFDKKKKYPMLTYCQGGPQSQIGQFFSWRWNFHVMAAQGYVVLAINRRGLPGFGNAWNEEISGDWGGQPMRDILSATDDMLTEPYIDAKKVSAIGASFGGYTVYWMMGNAQDRFSCMISHCGVFDLESMYGTTEELWFVDWDMGGPYWEGKNRDRYDQFSPHNYVENWKTPLLVIHGEKDFRVPVNQGMEAFTAAQVRGVPSRFLYFPEECHWVQHPQDGILWHRVFFDWLAKWNK